MPLDLLAIKELPQRSILLLISADSTKRENYEAVGNRTASGDEGVSEAGLCTSAPDEVHLAEVESQAEHEV